jgi:hypothetical protein
METPTAPPIDYPRVTIGGEMVELRKSFYSSYMLSKAGMGPEQLAAFGSPGDPHQAYAIMEIFASLAAWQFRESKPLTADQWAFRVGECADPIGKLAEVTRACFEALRKAPPVTTAPPPPVASAEQPPPVN